MNLLSYTGTLDEHRGFLRRVRQACQLHGKRRLLCERHQQLAVLNFRSLATEGQYEESNIAGAKDQRIDQHAAEAFPPMILERTRPDLPVAELGVQVGWLGASAEDFRERGAGERNAGRKWRCRELAFTNVREDPPLLQRVLGNDHRSGGGIELARRLEQHVAHEAVEIGLTGQPLEVAADNGIRLGKLGDLLLGSALTLTTHVINQPLPLPTAT